MSEQQGKCLISENTASVPVSEPTKAVPSSEQAARPEHKRPRRGETFLPHDSVELHSRDFSFAEHSSQFDVSGPPTATPTAALSLEEEQQHAANQGTSWEKHYVQNRQHFFPVKNYILRAFPCLFAVSRAVDIPEVDTSAVLESDATSTAASPSGNTAPAIRASERAPPVILEAGCGTGSALLPLVVALPPSTRFIGFDVSATAVGILREHRIARKNAHRIQAFPHDSVKQTLQVVSRPTTAASSSLNTVFPLEERSSDGKVEQLEARATPQDGAAEYQTPGSASSRTGAAVAPPPASTVSASPLIAAESADAVLLIFVLSAFPRDRMAAALRDLRRTMSQDAVLCIRDYGALDHNHSRFVSNENKTADGGKAFVKGDGTQQTFFSVEELTAVFAEAAFVPVEAEYHCNKVTNRKTKVEMRKVFVNATFVRSDATPRAFSVARSKVVPASVPAPEVSEEDDV